MPRLPVISANKAIKALEHFGFKIYRQTGSHIHLWNEQRNLVVTVPNHQELAKGTLISITKKTGRARMRSTIIRGGVLGPDTWLCCRYYNDKDF